MNLYIQVKNGLPYQHPILESNLVQVFPDIDLNNLPSEFARFTRVPVPEIGPYEIYSGVTYELQEDNSYGDVHHIVPMSEEEKTAKQNAVKTTWAANGYASWVFNEETCNFDPPTPYPTDGNLYNWDEETTSWVGGN